MKFKQSIVLLVLFLFNLVLSHAQSNPHVELVLSEERVASGESVTLDVIVRDGVNVAGLDVGVVVDETCLRIVEREAGDYLPTTEEEGAFSTFSAINDSDTRWAVALLDRTRYVNGNGTFYRLTLETICSDQVTPITITYAQVSSYIDPTAEIIEVQSYELSNSTLSVQNTALAIGDAVIVATQTPTSIVTDTTDSVDDIERVEEEQGLPTPVIFIIGITALSVIALLFFFFIANRKKKQEDEETTDS
ncbi:MAG: hypothetical protein ACFE0Q_16755 [Anaerolineae bacterium]